MHLRIAVDGPLKRNHSAATGSARDALPFLALFRHFFVTYTALLASKIGLRITSVLVCGPRKQSSSQPLRKSALRDAHLSRGVIAVASAGRDIYQYLLVAKEKEHAKTPTVLRRRGPETWCAIAKRNMIGTRK